MTSKTKIDNILKRLGQGKNIMSDVDFIFNDIDLNFNFNDADYVIKVDNIIIDKIDDINFDFSFLNE